MVDVDIDPIGEHDRTETRTDDDHTETGENIPFTPVERGRSSTWEPEREQETSFGGRESQRTKLMKDYVKDLYKSYRKTLMKPQNYFTTIISNSKVGNYTT